jgi:hypothetical protein
MPVVNSFSAATAAAAAAAAATTATAATTTTTTTTTTTNADWSSFDSTPYKQDSLLSLLNNPTQFPEVDDSFLLSESNC